MRIRRAIIIPAILTLGVTGSILAGAATHLAAASPGTMFHDSARVVAAASPNTMFHD
jgi:hypothetical protein